MHLEPDAVPEAVGDLGEPDFLDLARATASSSRASTPARTAASAFSCAERQTAYARRRSSGSSPVANVRVQSEQ